MTEPRTTHTDHDPLLIAALAAGDLGGREQAAASRLITDCRACSDLHADVVALAHATRDLPAPLRPRDFTLSREDAARARRTGWRRIAAILAGPRFAVARPVGTAFATLGLAGILLASLPGVPLAGAAADPAASAAPLSYERSLASGGVTSAADGAAIERDAGGETALPQPIQQAPEVPRGDDGTGQAGGDLAAEPGIGSGAGPQDEVVKRPTDATLAILSGTFLIVGLGLFGLRWTARRIDDL
jgi:anti-sigma factor RsiW